VSAHGPGARHRGRVSDFDDAAGYGTVSDGDQAWFFHCTAIADGSRRIDEGVQVAFVLEPGHLGRWEARDVQPA
jgi:cold shock protein